MAYLIPAAQGRHHRRPTHAQRKDPYLTKSDRRWVRVAVLLPLLLLATKPLPHTLVWAIGLLGLAVSMVLWRLLRHPGDRKYSGATPSREEHQEFLRTTGEIPVISPSAISPPVEAVKGPIWKPSTGQVLALGLAVFIQGLSLHSEHRVRQAREIDDANDALLGVPGRWNNYQPTVPSMGTRGWGPAPAVYVQKGQQWEHPRLY